MTHRLRNVGRHDTWLTINLFRYLSNVWFFPPSNLFCDTIICIGHDLPYQNIEKQNVARKMPSDNIRRRLFAKIKQTKISISKSNAWKPTSRSIRSHVLPVRGANVYRQIFLLRRSHAYSSDIFYVVCLEELIFVVCIVAYLIRCIHKLLDTFEIYCRKR